MEARECTGLNFLVRVMYRVRNTKLKKIYNKHYDEYYANGRKNGKSGGKIKPRVPPHLKFLIGLVTELVIVSG